MEVDNLEVVSVLYVRHEPSENAQGSHNVFSSLSCM